MKNKPLIIISGIVIAIILVLYIRVFTSKVTTLYGNTLSQTVQGNKTIYHSNVTISSSDIKIIVNTYSDDEVSVEFDLPKNTFLYTVKYKEETKEKHYIQIMEDKDIIFDGYYTINYFGENEYKCFYNLEGVEVLRDEITQVVIGDYLEDRLNAGEYEPGVTTIIKFVEGGDISIRGNWEYLCILIGIVLILIIDIRHPRFFFLLRHGLNVNNPEPSDYYLTCQKIFRLGIAPIFIICMIYMSLGF